MDISVIRKIGKHSKKLKAINYLGGKCSECNESYIFKLDFHHIDPNTKEFNISNMNKLRRNFRDTSFSK